MALRRAAGVFNGVLCRARDGRSISTSFPSDLCSMSLTTTFSQTINFNHFFFLHCSAAGLISWLYSALPHTNFCKKLCETWTCAARLSVEAEILHLALMKIISSRGALKETDPWKPYTQMSTRSSFK